GRAQSSGAPLDGRGAELPAAGAACRRWSAGRPATSYRPNSEISEFADLAGIAEAAEIAGISDPPMKKGGPEAAPCGNLGHWAEDSRRGAKAPERAAGSNQRGNHVIVPRLIDAVEHGALDLEP